MLSKLKLDNIFKFQFRFSKGMNPLISSYIISAVKLHLHIKVNGKTTFHWQSWMFNLFVNMHTATENCSLKYLSYDKEFYTYRR